MESAETLRVTIFIGLVASVYVIAAGALARKLSRRPPRRPVNRLQKVALVLAALGTLCVAWGFAEPYWLETVHVEVPSSKLASPLRIALLSDLHCDARVRLEEKLPDAVADAHPDVIVFTGDATNSEDGVPVFRALMGRLARIAPTFAVRGNWDRRSDAHALLFEGTGVRDLDGEAAPLRSDVWVAGVSVVGRFKIRAALGAVPPGAFTVFLCHWPDEIDVAAPLAPDLYLCGHTHGGQIALPFYGALATLSKFGKQYEHGLYRVEKTSLYVNRGIGMAGEGVVPLRFCARPELTIIDVTR